MRKIQPVFTRNDGQSELGKNYAKLKLAYHTCHMTAFWFLILIKLLPIPKLYAPRTRYGRGLHGLPGP